jgi:hypothetical protein
MGLVNTKYIYKYQSYIALLFLHYCVTSPTHICPRTCHWQGLYLVTLSNFVRLTTTTNIFSLYTKKATSREALLLASRNPEPIFLNFIYLIFCSGLSLSLCSLCEACIYCMPMQVVKVEGNGPVCLLQNCKDCCVYEN